MVLLWEISSFFVLYFLSAPVLWSHLMFMHGRLSHVVRHTIVNTDCLSKTPRAFGYQKIMSSLSETHEHVSEFFPKERLNTNNSTQSAECNTGAFYCTLSLSHQKIRGSPESWFCSWCSRSWKCFQQSYPHICSSEPAALRHCIIQHAPCLCSSQRRFLIFSW